MKKKQTSLGCKQKRNVLESNENGPKGRAFPKKQNQTKQNKCVHSYREMHLAKNVRGASSSCMKLGISDNEVTSQIPKIDRRKMHGLVEDARAIHTLQKKGEESHGSHMLLMSFEVES